MSVDRRATHQRPGSAGRIRGPRRSSPKKPRHLLVERLEQRQLLSLTGGTGPGGFELANGASPLALWLDASDLDANGLADSLANGSTVSAWLDKSGYGRHANGVMGTPAYVAASATANNAPVVSFSSAGGDDQLFTSYNFDGLGANYSVFGVSRYTGGDNERVITSKTRNWLFGHWGGGDERWHAESWIHNAGTANTNWHAYAGIIGPAVNGNVANPGADFWKDGVQLANDNQGSSDTAYKPGALAIGAWQTSSESSNAEVAQVVIFDRALNEAERRIVQNHLSSRYDIGIGSEDFYAGDTPANGDRDRDVFGIGRLNASNQLLDAGSAGFGIAAAALADDGDFVLAGHNLAANSKTTAGTLPSGVQERWARTWFVDVTDANNNLGATLSFDYSDSGLTRTTENQFTLLKSTDGGATWTAVATTTAVTDGDKVSFTVSAADLEDALYTLGDASPIPTVTTTDAPVYAQLGGATTVIDAGLTIVDNDSPNLAGATVSITANRDATDELLFTNQNGISGAYNSGTGVLSLSGVASVANYQTALRSVQFRNPNTGASLAARTITFAATDTESNTGPAARVLVPVATASADMIVWQGDVSSSWTTPGNWQDDRVPDSNDIAVFNDADSASTTVDVAGSTLVGEVRFVNVTDSFTFTGGTLTTDKLTQTGGGDNTINAVLRESGLAGTVFVGSISAGTLRLVNQANVLTGSIAVSSGAELVAKGDNSGGSLGTSRIDLDNGTLTFQAGATLPTDLGGVTSGLELWLDANQEITTDANGVSAWGDRNSATRVATRAGGAPALAANQLSGQPVVQFRRAGGDDWMNVNENFFAKEMYYVWRSPTPTFDNYGGILGAASGRNSTFITENNNTFMHSNQYPVAVSRNGVALASPFNMTPINEYMVLKVQVNDNNTGAKAYQVGRIDNYSMSLDLAEVVAYNRALSAGEQSSLEAYLTQKWLGAAANLAGVSVTVAGNSTIQLDTGLSSVQLNDLAMAAGSTLTVVTAGASQKLDFSGNTTLNGNAAVEILGNGTLSLNRVGETAPSDLSVAGNGTLRLPTANSYTGATTIGGTATVIASDGLSLGVAAAGTEVQAGGAVVLEGSYTTSEPFTLAGSGNSTADAALTGRSGDKNLDGPITLSANAKIRAQTNTLRLRGGVAIGASQLELRTDSRMEVDTLGISGAGSLRKTGGDWLEIGEGGAASSYGGGTTIAEGHVDIRGENAFGAGLITISANGCNFTTRSDVDVTNDITTTVYTVFRHEDATTSLYRGNVTLGGAAQFYVVNASGTLDVEHAIAGNQAATKTGPGRLTLQQANSFSNFVLSGGILRIKNENALGSATWIGVDAGEALEFDGSFTFDAADTLDVIHVNDGTLRAASGTTTLDIPVVMAPTGDVTFDGAGDLIVNQPLGSGAAPAIFNAVRHYGYTINSDATVMDLNRNGGMMGTSWTLKGSARAATTGPIALSGTPTIDGVALAPGDRVLVKDQANPAENGIYQVPAELVPLQNATAIRSQGGFNVSNLIDANTLVNQTTGTGWANNAQDNNIAVMETVVDLNPTGAAMPLVIRIGSGGYSTHELGKFRISVTNDDRSLFADGLQNGGDVTANWVELTPNLILTTGTSTFTINPDNTVLAGGTPQEYETYTIVATTTLANITGIRLEALEDPSLPSNGPGRGPSNGNFVVYNFEVSVAGSGPWTRVAEMNESSEVPNAHVQVLQGTANGGQGFATPGTAVVLGTDAVVWLPAASLLDPTRGPSYSGQSVLTSGPADRGLDYDQDQDFWDGAIPVNHADNYSDLFLSTLHVTPANAGNWTFRIAAQDDPCGIWLDLDRDGVFESSTAGLGSNRGEQLAWNDTGVKTVNLAAGDYMIAFTHREGGSGSQIDARIKAPTWGAERVVRPNEPEQAGLWRLTVAPDNHVTKNGAGTLTLAGDNAFNGRMLINEGTVIAAHDNAFGADGGNVFMLPGATLAFSGGVTVDGENITGADGRAAGQAGTIVNLDGDNAFLGDIAATTSPIAGQEVTIASLSGQLTIGAVGLNTLDLKGDRLTFDGAGSVVVNSDITNLTAPFLGTGLRHYGYHINNDGLAMDLNNNAGMVNGNPPNPTGFSNFRGQAILTSGPGGRGLDFNSDQDFIDTGCIGQTDNYSNLFLGILHVDAAMAGNWNFRIRAQDDPTGIWIDLDQDGVFESTTAGLGSDRGEQLRWNSTANKTVSLAAGDYLIAFTHREGGGGSQIEAGFQAPGMPAEVVIKPADPAQSSIFLTTYTPQNGVAKKGAGTATLAGDNTYLGETSVEEGVLAVASSTALGSTSADTTVTNGATLGILGDTTLTGETITLDGLGAPIDLDGDGSPEFAPLGALVSLGGDNTIDTSVTLAAKVVNLGQIGIGSAFAGQTLTIDADVDLKLSGLVVDGAGETVINGVVGSSLSMVLDPIYPDYILGNPLGGLPGLDAVGYWRLGETSLPTAVDQTGARDGTYTNFVAGDLGKAGAVSGGDTSVQIDGTDNYVAVPHDDALNTVLTGDYSVGFWMYKDSEAGDWVRLIGKGDLSANDRRTLGVWEEGGSAKRLLYQVYVDGGSSLNFYSTSNLDIGKWYHVVVTKEGNTGKIYLNGQLDAQGTMSGTIRTDTSPLTIGRNPWRHATFPGRLDEVSVHDRALSAAEIEDLYESRNGTGVFLPDNFLAKQGAGTLTLTAANAYQHGTTVVEGTLLVNNATGSGTGSGEVTVEDGGLLGGTGTVSGAVTVESGGMVDPGTSPGRLTDGGTTLQAGGTLRIEINGPTAAADYDQLRTDGLVLGDGLATLDLSRLASFNPGDGDEFTIVDNTSADPVDGYFADAPEGSLVAADGVSFRITYQGGTGNDVVLARVPFGVNRLVVDAGQDLDGDDALRKIGDGPVQQTGMQHSMVTRIVLTLDGVATLDPGAITLARTGTGGGAFSLDVASQVLGGTTRVVVTISANSPFAYARAADWALADGDYRLTVDPSKIHDVNGPLGTAAVDYLFHRFYGDSDGDRDVDATDLNRLRRVILGDPNFADYEFAFDQNGDAAVDGFDYTEFRKNYGRKLRAAPGALQQGLIAQLSGSVLRRSLFGSR